MDRNTIIGLLLIGAILIGFQYYNTHEMEKNFEEKIVLADSLFKTEHYKEARELYKKAAEYQPSAAYPKNQVDKIADLLGETKQLDSNFQQNVNSQNVEIKENDSASVATAVGAYGVFANASKGDEKFYTLENSKMKITFSNKGGRPYKIMLKEYKTYTQEDLYLMNGEGNEFTLNFFSQNRPISTQGLIFKYMAASDSIFVDQDAQTVKFRLYADSSSYIDYIYSLAADDYMMKFNINFVGMQKYIPQSTNFVDLYWKVNAPAHERGKKWEAQNTTIYYQYLKDAVEKLSEQGSKEEQEFTTKTKWIAFKQQFFASILMADNDFEAGKISYKDYDDSSEYVTRFSAELNIPVDFKDENDLGFKFYFGPNKYSLLKKYNTIIASKDDDVQLEQMVPLGWTLFRWINKLVIIPLFDFLGKYIANYGIIILVLTLLIKTVLFPFTYKSYVSSARMRVLKPEIDAINAKIPKDKAMERQQATMALYKKVGVSPMGGCLPMVFQFPILIALYLFFPSSIELRQKSFLWATDLSSYDSIMQLPFNIPMYGDHISLFALLMAIAMLISTMMNSAQMGDSANQLPGMKTVMYLMPVMMVVWFNNYSAGLSYYYFLSSVITIGQTYIIRLTVDENEILRKLKENKKKPVKKSKFQERLELLQKQQAIKGKK
jgi:YidC/Oxa1 family membrane protein insertase